MSKSDPLGYAIVFDEYEMLLRKGGRITDANVVQNKAKALRTANPDGKAKFKPESYPVCSASIHS